MIAEAGLIEQLEAVQAVYENGLSRLTHGLATLVFEHLEAYTAHWRKLLLENRPTLVQFAEEGNAAGWLEGRVPEHGCMYFPRLPGIADTREFAVWLWCNYEIVVAPGEYFGAPGHIRIGFDHAGQAQGLERLAQALRRRARDGG